MSLAFRPLQALLLVPDSRACPGPDPWGHVSGVLRQKPKGVFFKKNKYYLSLNINEKCKE
jgi:hypothetical protein